jgi:DNA-binding XRE family transcriptional regulator
VDDSFGPKRDAANILAVLRVAKPDEQPRGLKWRCHAPPACSDSATRADFVTKERFLTRRPKKPRDAPEEEPISPERLVVAEKLIAARRAAGLTQVQLAEVSGISQSHISHLENATWEPRLATILALCRALSVSPTDLLPNIGKLADG